MKQGYIFLMELVPFLICRAHGLLQMVFLANFFLFFQHCLLLLFSASFLFAVTEESRNKLSYFLNTFDIGI